MLVEGFASTPDIDLVRDRVPPSAFTQSIAQRGIRGPKGVKLLWQHDRQKPLGPIEVLEVRNNGLWIQAEIDEAISWGKDAAAVLSAIGEMSFSIGYRVLDADVGRDAQGEYIILRKLDLQEVSVVTFPCNPEAVMTNVGKRLSPSEKMEREIRKFKQALGGTSAPHSDPFIEAARRFKAAFQ